MSDELYENLKEMYKSFYLEKEAVKEKINRHVNDNDYQLYNNQLISLESRVNTLNAVIQLFDINSQFGKNENEIESNNGSFSYANSDNANSQNANLINKRLQVLDIQERERQRIARDLHDTSLQNLAHIVHKIELSSMYIDQDSIRAKLELAAISKSLKSVIQEIRNTIFDLRPMTFDDLGFKESFERLVDRMKEISNIQIDYNIEDIECNNSLILMTIFRIVEECVNNAIKHSDGSRVFFEVKKDNESNCIIIVSDNGKSFDAKEVLSVEDRHFGLCILRERVNLLSGTINIDSRPENGTVIKIIIPLLNY